MEPLLHRLTRTRSVSKVVYMLACIYDQKIEGPIQRRWCPLYTPTIIFIVNASSFEKTCSQFLIPTAVLYMLLNDNLLLSKFLHPIFTRVEEFTSFSDNFKNVIQLWGDIFQIFASILTLKILMFLCENEAFSNWEWKFKDFSYF